MLTGMAISARCPLHQTARHRAGGAKTLRPLPCGGAATRLRAHAGDQLLLPFLFYLSDSAAHRHHSLLDRHYRMPCRTTLWLWHDFVVRLCQIRT